LKINAGVLALKKKVEEIIEIQQFLALQDL